jgi:hypothetical protein
MTDHERPDDYTLSIHTSKRPVSTRTRRRPSDGLVEPAPVDTIFYGINGQPTLATDEVIAKITMVSEVHRFYLLFSTSGHDIGHMVNPYGIYFNKNDLKREQAKTGRDRYEFREVSEDTFNKYIDFLITRNESFLRVAERMVLDA